MTTNYFIKDNLKYKNLLQKLVDISVNGLHEMYIPERYEFALKKKVKDDGYVLEETSLRYTLINLIGLYKAESNDVRINIDLKKTIEHHINNCDKMAGVGEIGLLLWATALILPEKICNILTKINFKSVLTSYKDAKAQLSMELSWLLTGLLMAATFDSAFKNSIGNLPEEVYTLIRNNYSGKGIFRHQGNNTLVGKFRGSLASFADQIYPIFALALYSQQKNNQEALLISKECATHLCELQGSNGEWYWHYDSKTGEVIGKYPIYSVHQDAMAPMALYAIQKASKVDFEKSIFKGLDWLMNQNCLNQQMFDEDKNFIWRAIEPAKTHRKLKSTLNQMGFSSNKNYNNLKLLEESWSYHFGWILYAFAGRINENSKTNNSQEFNNNLRLFNIS